MSVPLRLLTAGLPVVVAVLCFHFTILGNEGAQVKEAQAYLVGISKIDITPDYPVRLNGYGSRREEHEGVAQKIYAKALAIQKKGADPVIIVTVDSLGIRLSMVEEVARRLNQKTGLPRERFAVTFSHSHCTPKVNGACDTIFSHPIPAKHQKHIDRYTRDLTNWIEKAALNALGDLQPSTLSWSIGKVGFAMNRRTKDGPVDHDLPTMVIRDAKTDAVRGIYLSYACHCTTLSNNRISGDWSGYAQAGVEEDNEGAVCLVSIGCGSDSNPNARKSGNDTTLVKGHGESIRKEVARLLEKSQAPLRGDISAKLNHIALPLQQLPTRGEWTALAKRGGPAGYSAAWHLAKLDRGEKLMESIRYPIQTFSFGDDLSMLFLAGEVCVDYSLRLKKELARDRVWINAYANDFCSYIPSERLLNEGGYGGGAEMVYFGVPTILKPGMEKLIVDEVHRQVPESFSVARDPQRTGGSRPLSPEESCQRIELADEDLAVELVAAEPLVTDPVAIDFGADGKLWVCEMSDYPEGIDGKYGPGGRIKFLEDTNGDGHFDKSTVFADGLPFPTEVKVWKRGVLVCAAPDVLYLEDRNGDGRADHRRVILTGFATHNYQARVNSIRLGLDNWLYASVGLFGGEIESFDTKGKKGQSLALSGRDFRFDPDTGALEPAAGNSQQGRVRDDWGHWFGCTNGSLIKHYPLHDHVVRRNPHVAPPPPEQAVPGNSTLFPARPDMQLFKLSGGSGKATAACGLGIYRDNLLGSKYAGDGFTCEPVNLLVHRTGLDSRPDAIGFSSRQAEGKKEFLASTDRWFRPVQARTGPDGALWIVDMYRFVIEHPRWIPEETLAELNVRAGSNRGRIYRVYSKKRPPRKMESLDQLDTTGLVEALGTTNGIVRDLAHQLLLWREDRNAIKPLSALASDSTRPAIARLHAMCVLDGMNELEPTELLTAMKDPDPRLRAQAARLCATRLNTKEQLHGAFLQLTHDESAEVQMQAAIAMGDWKNPRAVAALAALLSTETDPYLTGAALSSAVPHAASLAGIMVKVKEPLPALPRILATAIASEDAKGLAALGHELALCDHWNTIAAFLQAVSRKDMQDEEKMSIFESIRGVTARARSALDEEEIKKRPELHLQRLAVLGWIPGDAVDDLAVIEQLIQPKTSSSIVAATLDVIARLPGSAIQERAAEMLLAKLTKSPPSTRSQILDTLLTRSSWTARLVSHLEKETTLLSIVGLSRSKVLRTHPDQNIAKRAAKLFAVPDRDRQAVVRKYLEAPELQGDQESGSKVFANHCASCHRIDETGLAIGPDLLALSDRSAPALLNGILDPNAAVLDQYVLYAVTLRNGTDVAGIISAETSPALTVTQLNGEPRKILRKEIAAMTSTNRSLMPEGLESAISRQSMADLIAYLQKATPGK